MSTSFSSLPSSQNSRKRILRQARMGARPSPVIPAYEDAFGTLQAVGRYVESFNSSEPHIEFFQVLKSAWQTRGE